MSRLPAVFLGHGNPLNALEDNDWTRAWRALGPALPRPRAILAVSAHWYIEGTAVTAMRAPRTIYDFGGFPDALYRVRYPAAGDPQLAARVQQLLAPVPVSLDESWGLDHGSWSLLVHAFPAADVPVIQLSLDARQPPRFHYELGRRLAALRDEGVLILGSGDVVHNLRAYTWGAPATPAYPWALRFEALVRERLSASDHESLIDYAALGEDARASIPTPEHYLPLLYVLGASAADEPLAIVAEGFDGGAVSMLGIRLG